jgi:hypothetical protein
MFQEQRYHVENRLFQNARSRRLDVSKEARDSIRESAQKGTQSRNTAGYGDDFLSSRAC